MKRWIFIALLAAVCIFLLYVLGDTTNQLGSTQASLGVTQGELATTRTELSTVKTQLDTANGALTTVQNTLGVTKTELTTVQKTLDSTRNELTATKKTLDTTRVELDSTRSSLATRTKELQTTVNELAAQKTGLAELQVSYDGLVSGHGYTIKDPTYNQMLNFVREDATDKNKYIVDKYECRHFATDICNNAESKGIRCAYVLLAFPDGTGHAIIAFNTIDKGLIYIEPQSDDMVKLEIGKRYWQCVIPSGNNYYPAPSYDDTVTEVLVAW